MSPALCAVQHSDGVAFRRRRPRHTASLCATLPFQGAHRSARLRHEGERGRRRGKKKKKKPRKRGRKRCKEGRQGSEARDRSGPYSEGPRSPWRGAALHNGSGSRHPNCLVRQTGEHGFERARAPGPVAIRPSWQLWYTESAPVGADRKPSLSTSLAHRESTSGSDSIPSLLATLANRGCTSGPWASP